MKISDKIIALLTYLDFFQQNVSLKLNHRYRVSLLSGKLLSLGIIIFLIYNAAASNMIKKENPIVLQQTLEDAEKPEIFLNRKNFGFSFGLSNEFSFVEDDQSLFTYNVKYVDLRMGGETYYEQTREIERCTNDHFKQYPETYDQLMLNKTNCLKNGTAFLKGYWDDHQAYYLSVKLEKCVNSTDGDIICKSEQEISEYFKNKYFNIFYQQNNFDLSNFDTPISSKIKTFYTGLEYGRKKENRLFLKKTTIFSDYQIIFSHEDIFESYSFDRIEADASESENTIYEIQIYSSEVKTILKRRYEKLFELLALLGGITSALKLIFMFVFKILYDWKISEMIMNNLFTIRVVSEAKGKKTTNQPPKVIQITPKGNKILNDFKLSIWEKILLMVKRKKSRSEKEVLYLDYIKKSGSKIDLIEVLKKLEEIDKLKFILLNEEQTKLFDSMSKRYVFSGDHAKRQRGTKYSLGLPQDDTIRTNAILAKIKIDAKSNEIDKRLINLIEKE